MLEIEPFERGPGARITNLRLNDTLEDAQWAQIEDAWNRFHLLVFPDQHDLTTEGQVRFLERFGRVIEERMPGDKHSFVSNADGVGTDDMNDGYREGELTPHMDYTYTPYPADAISLFSVALPEGGSHTLFYSNVAPLAAMPRDLVKTLRSYSIFCAHDLASMRPDARLYAEDRTDPDAPTQSHVWPLVRSHPSKPGVEILTCCLQQTERILELSNSDGGDRDSFEVLDRIFNEYLYVPENAYRHEWALGDLVLWDNLALQHARAACPRTRGDRTFRRVALCEAGNAIQETVAFLDLQDASQAFA